MAVNKYSTCFVFVLQDPQTRTKTEAGRARSPSFSQTHCKHCSYQWCFLLLWHPWCAGKITKALTTYKKSLEHLEHTDVLLGHLGNSCLSVLTLVRKGAKIGAPLLPFIPLDVPLKGY